MNKFIKTPQAKVLFATIISSFTLIATNNVIFGYVPVDEGGGGATPPPEPTPLIKVESCKNGSFEGYTYKNTTYGSKTYSNPEVKYNSGDVYERAITESDFSATQEWTRPEYKDKYAIYDQIQDLDDTDTTDYYCDNPDKEVYVGKDYQGEDKGTDNASSSISLSNVDTRTSDGKWKFTATVTRNGKTGSDTGYSYWVSDVKFSSSSGQKEVRSDKPEPTVVCEVVYGNGVTKNCSVAQNLDSADAEQAITDTFNTEKGIMTSQKVSGTMSSWLTNKEPDDGKLSYGSHPTRLHDSHKQDYQLKRDDTLTRKSTSSSGGARKAVYDAGFGQLIIYSFADSKTNVKKTFVHHLYKAAFVDVEDEVRSPFKKTVYKLYKEIDAGDTENVTCTIWFFGPNPIKNCKNEMLSYSETQLNSNKHKEGYSSVRDWETEKPVETVGEGGPVRYAYYVYDYNDGFDTIGDEDVRSIYYADQMAMYDHGPYPYLADVKVLETHDKGVAKPSTYNRGDGVSWSLPTTEVYEYYEKPKCDAIYISNFYGHVEKRPCTLLMTFDVMDRINGGLKTSSSFTYDYSETFMNERSAEYLTISNGAFLLTPMSFHYPTKVEMSMTKSKTYQDEPYPEYTCIKTYEYLIVVPMGNTHPVSCLDKMYIDSDTGQNKTMGGEREITYRYKIFTHNKSMKETRVYANRTEITAPASSGKSGFRGKYTADVVWQDNTRKDITFQPNVWSSTVASTGETVNYIGETWSGGYTDAKGVNHRPSTVNELYIPDPISKTYRIYAKYPTNGPFNNGLTPGYGYATDVPAQVNSYKTFDVIGISRVDMYDNTVYVHQVDKDSNGNQLTNSFGKTKATTFNGSRSTPSSGFSPILAFNDKTYQTGHFYDFIVEITWDNGTVERADISKYPELTWRYRNAAGTWKYNYSDYPVAGHTFGMPESGSDHRLLLEGWNPIRFDLFSESSIRKPSGQTNAQYQQTYTVVHAWAHQPVGLVIVGPSWTDNASAEHEYKSYLNWNDGVSLNQSAQSVGSNTNPWGGNHNKPTEVTNKVTSMWWKDEKKLTTPASGPLKTVLDDYEGTLMYRTIASSWGDDNRVLPGFDYWDYFNSELDVLLSDNGPGPVNNCDSNVPEMNCAIPVDKPGSPNYRLPKDVDIATPRVIEHGIKFRVTGISQGSGE